MKLVKVEMVDMEHDARGWQHPASIRADKPMRYVAVGWVIKRTKRWLIITPVMRRDGGQASCAYRIPRGSIRSVRRIRRGRPQ